MKMKLNIQKFAEEAVEGNVVGNDTATQQAEVKTPTFTELLQNPEYQKEFDKLVDKSLKTAKSKWETDYQAKLEAQRTEAERLAQMDAEQKLNYELEKANKERDELRSQLNAQNLYRTACDIANDKGLPVGYLNMLDFSKENAESVSDMIDKLVELRNNDLKTYIDNRLQQNTPQERRISANSTDEIDPFIEGFKSEF